MWRLRSKRDFATVLRESPLVRTQHFAMHATDPGFLSEKAPTAASVIGVVIPKRYAKRAVTRNLVRRQIYAAIDAAEDSLPCRAYVVRLKSAIEKQRYPSASSEPLKLTIRQEIQRLLQRARELGGTAHGQ